MAWWLREHTAFSEDSGSMLSTHAGQLITTWQASAPGNPTALLYSRVTYTHHIHNLTQTYICTYNYKGIQINLNETIISHHLKNPRELTAF